MSASAYGAEGRANKDSRLFFVHNSVINDRARGGTFLKIKPGAEEVLIANNLFRGRMLDGTGELLGNIEMEKPPVLQRMRYDYRPQRNCRLVDAAVDPKSATGIDLTPLLEYQHPARTRPRPSDEKRDVGAYESAP